jgi:hypothetical protein
MSLVVLQADKGFKIESEEEGLVPEEGSSGIAHKRQRTLAQSNLGRTPIAVLAHSLDPL